jgi:hypothetical protein
MITQPYTTTNNEREHFILQINECSVAISFDKASTKKFKIPA